MIGVVTKEENRAIVEEFFELFKTPWQFYSPGSSCDILITTEDDVPETDAQVVIIYGTRASGFDKSRKLKRAARSMAASLFYSAEELPVYKGMLLFPDEKNNIVASTQEGQTGAFILNATDDETGKKILRVGYNLFKEVAFLLQGRQPIEQALNPTIEIHIALLRDFILSTGIQLVEVPPVPVGHPFFTSLTHDVDFTRILDHKFDRTFFGFIFRALFTSSSEAFKSRSYFHKFIRNVKAFISLPGIYLGLLPDIWLQLNRYMELEEGLSSTFYFIPFNGQPGSITPDRLSPPASRAAKYVINNHSDTIKRLIDKGFEIGLHGIDAWHDSATGRKELEVINGLVGNDSIGIRMHWLYFSEKSPLTLKESGFFYDSTLGYNETVGYRSGTLQVYKLPGSGGLFEVPLNVMDCAMFYPSRMGLSEDDALKLCKSLIQKNIKYGGLFTVNWHQRSIAPERCWDLFYIELIEELKSSGTCFVTAQQAVKWFEMRRSIQFEEISPVGGSLKVRLRGEQKTDLPPLRIRLHNNGNKVKTTGQNHTDIEWHGESEVIYEQYKR